MKMQQITDSISYFPASEAPLSANVGVIQCEDGAWLFDVGSSEEAAAAIEAIPEQKKVVLSHFHEDHIRNIGCVSYEVLYAGKYTCQKLHSGIAVEGSRYFENGIHLFPLPTAHAKGCVGLEYGDYAFLGDAVYPAVKKGEALYNAGLLRELIAVLKSLGAKWFLLSHCAPFAHPKEDVIAKLEEIYAQRDRQSPYIRFPSGAAIWRLR